MAVSRVKTSSILQGFPKSRSLLAGNTAYDPAATFLIQRVAGTGTSSITFSSIPSTYKHLQIRWMARSLRVGVSDNLNIQFNSDTSTNYAPHYLAGDGASASAGSNGANYTQIDAFNSVRASGSSNTNTCGVGIIDIHDYASTTKNKTVRVFSGWDFNGTGYSVLSSGVWLNSSTAISSIILKSDGNNFATNSTFALYGMKG
jgi:hypothetical protein